MIWDLHCHLSGVDGRMPGERIAQVIEIGDRMGIERYVFYMGYPMLQDPAPDEFRQQNDQVIEALSHWHLRAFGFAYLNPKHEEESLKELDRTGRWWGSSCGSQCAATTSGWTRSFAGPRS